MDEKITITMSRKMWADVLIDLSGFEKEMDAGLYDHTDELEPGSYQLQHELRNKGMEF